MATVAVDSDPGELGLDSDRLRRIDTRLARYVDEGRLPGWQVVVTRRGKIVHASCHGQRDVAAGLPVEPDTIFRIYSMTKPITSVAAMMLWEQGEIQLDDPISNWLPEFANPRVYRTGSDVALATVPAIEPIRVWHLLTHTSGFTYSFHRAHPVDGAYRNAGLDEMANLDQTLAQMSERWAAQPLVFQPGSEWLYSVSTDVLGRLIEVISGRRLESFVEEEILRPLGMADTVFTVDPARASRLAQLYQATPNGFVTMEPTNKAALTPRWTSGGGGLSSTAADYHRFTQFLLNHGELDGTRLLAPSTVARMTMNHLPGGVDLDAFGRPLYAEMPMRGIGFGLGFSMVISPTASRIAASMGDYGWGGLASTTFTVDPIRGLTMMFFTQLIPSSALPIRQILRQLVHASIID